MPRYKTQLWTQRHRAGALRYARWRNQMLKGGTWRFRPGGRLGIIPRANQPGQLARRARVPGRTPLQQQVARPGGMGRRL